MIMYLLTSLKTEEIRLQYDRNTKNEKITVSEVGVLEIKSTGGSEA